MLPDTSALDSAVLGVLQGDAALAALMPDGVYWDIAPPGATAFVTVTQQDSSYDLVFSDADATERNAYLVKAIARTTAGGAVQDAAARIHNLLHRQVLTLTGTGYELMLMKRTRRVRYTESDPANHAIQWQHVGGVYDVLVTCGVTPAN